MITTIYQPTDFTWRETEIIHYLKNGFTTKEIAHKLNLSTFTIKKHRENIASKLGTHGKTEFRIIIFNINPPEKPTQKRKI